MNRPDGLIHQWMTPGKMDSLIRIVFSGSVQPAVHLAGTLQKHRTHYPEGLPKKLSEKGLVFRDKDKSTENQAQKIPVGIGAVNSVLYACVDY